MPKSSQSGRGKGKNTKLTTYQLHMKKAILGGLSFSEAAHLWSGMKAVKSRLKTKSKSKSKKSSGKSTIKSRSRSKSRNSRSRRGPYSRKRLN